MSDFKQAIQWLKEGKKVRNSRLSFDTDYIILGVKDFKHCRSSEEGYDWSIQDFEATDWEIFEEAKGSLSDRMIVVDKHFVHYPEVDVKEKIQNAQKRLKELVVDSDYCVCCGNDEEKLFKAINKIFKEEFGEKLQ